MCSCFHAPFDRICEERGCGSGEQKNEYCLIVLKIIIPIHRSVSLCTPDSRMFARRTSSFRFFLFFFFLLLFPLSHARGSTFRHLSRWSRNLLWWHHILFIFLAQVVVVPCFHSHSGRNTRVRRCL